MKSKAKKLDVEDAAVFLTPGSVWLRDNGSKSTLLFVTNSSLPARVQTQFPPQAVYLDEEGNVLNRSVEDFIANRTFHNVVAEVETQVEGLLAYRDLDSIDEEAGEEDDGIEISDEDGEDDGELLISGGDDADEAETEGDVDAGLEAASDSSDDQPTLVVLDVPEVAPGSLRLFADALEDAIVGYRQEPILSHSLMAHVLVIDTDELDSTVEEIVAAFDPDNNPNLIPSFTVRGLPKVVWGTFIGAYSQMTNKKFHLAVYLGTDMATVEETSTMSSIDVEIAGIEASLANAGAAETEVAVAEGVVAVEVVDPAPVEQPAVEVAVAAAAPVQVQAAVTTPAPVVVS